jgi:PAT family beta-lactamase induction signal transducer AmpG
MLVNELAVPLFKHLGASLGTIGLTALFHLPWNLKFLWGHAVDGYETKRRWVLAIEAVLAVAMFGLAFIANKTELLGAISVAFLVIATLSATHDIAVDGFYLEALDEAGQSKFVGLRAMAYRLAMLSIAGPGLMLVSRVGWTASLVAIAVAMALLVLLHALVLPSPETRQLPLATLIRRVADYRVFIVGLVGAVVVMIVREVATMPWLSAQREKVPLSITEGISVALLLFLVTLVALRRRLQRRLMNSQSQFAQSFQSFVAQPRVGVVLAFIVLFRVGESLLIKMKLPFLMDDVGMSLDTYAKANGTVGLIASIGGSLLGGWLISRHGLRRWIWPMVLAQNVLNLLYVGLAYAAGAGLGITLATVVIALERIGEGMGTAVFMVYLMRCCSPKHKAAHMAIATALMSVGYTVAGASSGFIAQATGFRTYFLMSFFATIPAMVLIFFLPHLDRREEIAL